MGAKAGPHARPCGFAGPFPVCVRPRPPSGILRRFCKRGCVFRARNGGLRRVCKNVRAFRASCGSERRFCKGRHALVGPFWRARTGLQRRKAVCVCKPVIARHREGENAAMFCKLVTACHWRSPNGGLPLQTCRNPPFRTRKPESLPQTRHNLASGGGCVSISGVSGPRFSLILISTLSLRSINLYQLQSQPYGRFPQLACQPQCAVERGPRGALERRPRGRFP